MYTKNEDKLSIKLKRLKLERLNIIKKTYYSNVLFVKWHPWNLQLESSNVIYQFYVILIFFTKIW